MINGYLCQCPSNTFGDDCQFINECFSNPCQNGATCEDGDLSFTCICPPGFNGTLCEQSFDDCISQPCLNNGTCFDGPNRFICVCTEEYDGETCEIDLNLCRSSPCLNNGTCLNAPDSFSCQCQGFSGDICQYPNCPSEILGEQSWPETEFDQEATLPCPAGYSGGYSRRCGENGTWTEEIQGSCEPNVCPADIEGNAKWNETNALVLASGVCLENYFGSPTRYCNPNGEWRISLNGCQRISCPEETFYNASWPRTPNLSMGNGTCDSGFTGSPQRYCTKEGAWEDELAVPCERIQCPSDTIENAAYPATDSFLVAAGECVQGYSGSPERSCNADGSWGDGAGVPCARNQCPEEVFEDISWPAALSLTNPVGQCPPGFSGSPQRACLGTGEWAENIQNPCVQNQCPEDIYDQAEWATTLSMETAYGTCVLGYSGMPSRYCQPSGAWESTVQNPCERNSCPAETYGNAQWSDALSLTTVSGTCLPEYEGDPSRTCYGNGTWSEIQNPCILSAEQNTLEQFYAAMNFQIPGWDILVNLCEQNGVTCSDGHVIRLFLSLLSAFSWLFC